MFKFGRKNAYVNLMGDIIIIDNNENDEVVKYFNFKDYPPIYSDEYFKEIEINGNFI